MTNKIGAIVLTVLMMVSAIPLTMGSMAADYAKDTKLNNVDASFIPPASPTPYYFGYTDLYPSSRGDVNGDGFDDLLIGDMYYDNASTLNVGAVYLMFGKATGWAKDTVMDPDVIFEGEVASDNAGYSIGIVGDVNGDGLDDIVISSMSNAEKAAGAGQVYLIFGKATGWPARIMLKDADASFWGERTQDGLGWAISGAGDVNGDGFDDILLGSLDNRDFGLRTGKAYLILGKSSGWAKDVNVSAASSASYHGEFKDDCAGTVAGAGDVNGDGLDDFLVGSACYGSSLGKTYLIMGKTTGWAKNANLSVAEASFIGVIAGGQAGYGVMGAGDVNGDGFDDILISATWGGPSTEVYLILGRATPWAINTSLANADASFVEEAVNNQLGWGLGGGADVNGDGLDDFILGSGMNAEGGNGAGQSYLILGKTSGWAKGVNVGVAASASFQGEAINNDAGIVATIVGDINGDGTNDIMITAPDNGQVAANAGKAYLIFQTKNKFPSTVASIKAFASADYTNETGFAMQGDKIYVELAGTDANASRKDLAVVKLSSTSNLIGYTMDLFETAVDSGVYRGVFSIKDRTHEGYSWIKGLMGDTVTVKSATHPTVKAEILVAGPIQIMPLVDDTTATEDELYNVHYYLSNATVVEGIFDKNATWLTMNESTQNLSGTPDNSNVGSFWVRLNVTDGFGRTDEHNFTIVVANTLPVIETTNVLIAIEDQPYAVDYNSSDDGQGTIVWSMETNASAWLTLNDTTGNLTGNPINVDVGAYYVNITVDDGNGGTDFTNFTLDVRNVNDGPGIITTDVLTATEDVLYSVDYNAVDVDVGDVLTWSLKTNAGAWLHINAVTGVLNGTPTNADVGQYWVNVTVKDLALSSDFTNFTLTVENAEDAPVWKDVPPAVVHINSLEVYTFDVNATDIDVGDVLHYGVLINPTVTMVTMNMTFGYLRIGPVDAGLYNVNLSVTDGTVKIYYSFTLNVSHKNSPPTATLVVPLAGATITTAKPTLRWDTLDKDLNAVTVDVYLSDTEANVNNKAASARIATASSVNTYVYTTYLVPGKKYFWTVIPKDATDTGTCLNGTFNFTVSATAKVNHVPTIVTPAKIPGATTGKTYKLTVAGADADTGSALTYSLTGNPAGMTIDNTGKITWKPSKSQSGTFTFNVVVSDGEFSASTPVTLKVKKAPEATFATMMLPILLILILVVVAIVLLAFAMRKKPADKDEDEEEVEEKDEKEEE